MNESNIANRTIFLHDNLEILQGLNSACIDLIYLDPPFNKNKVFSAPIGSGAEGAEFSDIFREEDVKDEWLQTIKSDYDQLFTYLNGIKGVGKPYNFAYLAYMAIRLIECHRILKLTGSLYLHCDPTMSHYLKTTLDCIFGEEKFRNEIVWKRNPSHEDSKVFGNVSDNLLFYGADINKDDIRIPLGEESKAHYKYEDQRGRYRPENLKAGGLQGGGYTYDFCGHTGPWRCPETTMRQYERDDRIHYPKKADGVPQRKRYLTDHPGLLPTNIWLDIKKARGSENTKYPTQKPLALLDRIIKASSREGDIVLDPFCGCATTCVAAENLGRQWIGIDVSVKAYELVKERLETQVARPDALPTYRNEIHLKTNPPRRTDLGAGVRPTRFVYIISHPMFPNFYKVGVAKNVKARLNSYQTSDPERSYKLEFAYETHLYYETEAHIHELFDNKYEWVKADLEDIKQAIRAYPPV